MGKHLNSEALAEMAKNIADPTAQSLMYVGAVLAGITSLLEQLIEVLGEGDGQT